MTPFQNKIFISLAAVAILLLVGCAKEPRTSGNEGIRLDLKIDGANNSTISSKATVAESAVSNLWVLQFQMTASSTTQGVLVGKTYLPTVTDPTKVQFKCVAGENMAFYLVANTADANLFKNLATGTSGASLASVKIMTIPVTATAGTGLPSDASVNLPMIGQSANIASLPISTAISVTLTRLISKIVLTVKNPFEAGYPQLKIQQVQLKRIPKLYSIQLIRSTNFDGSTDAKRYPAAAAANFIDYTPVTGNITEDGTNYLWYVAPNARGTSTNTDPRLKGAATAPTGQGDYCSYIEITATAQASATEPTVDVRYRLYLGSNSTNSFNIRSNTTYKVGIELTGINSNDARMVITTNKFDFVQGGSDGDHSENINGWELYESYFTGTEADAPFIISPRWLEADRLWQTTPSPTGITDAFDGKGNTAKLLAIPPPNDSPAAKYCRSFGDDWYIPSQAQLMLLWIYRDAIPVAERSIRNSAYWSSTESSILNYHIWGVHFSTDGYSNYHLEKISIFPIRCIRDNPAVGANWKYPKVDTDGRTIISREGTIGVKDAALLSAAQKTFLMNQSTQPLYTERSEYNKVSAKFQVAAAECSLLNCGITADVNGQYTWADTYRACKGYSESGASTGTWRLPTQRELMLMWVLNLRSTRYWMCSGTVNSLNSHWLVDVRGYCGQNTGGLGTPHTVRCVRDL